MRNFLAAFVGLSLCHGACASAEDFKFNRQTLRRVGQVSASICRGYFELLNPVAGVRELRARARVEHNRAAFAFEDRLIKNSTNPQIRPAHAQDELLQSTVASGIFEYRVLVNHRRLYLEGGKLTSLPRGTAVLINPETALVEFVFKP